MKFWKLALLFSFIYLALYVFCLVNLTEYEEFYQFGDKMTFMQKISLFIYKFILNFPLSIFLWFLPEKLHLTIVFFLQNAVLSAWIVKRIFKLH